MWGKAKLQFIESGADSPFVMLDTASPLLVRLSLLLSLSLCHAAMYAPQGAFFSELFGTSVRYSGASLSLTLGTIVGGAIAPIVATYLFSLTGTSTLITVYMTAVSVVSYLCSLGLRETYRDSLSQHDSMTPARRAGN